ncbi:MAG: hypothetical protein DHS20C16_03350 [Phycisphaerae bacterium]|nr:MAG: hypothetical protein DHS20C16_03350 [Phycisphaerae bacterium]
MTEDKTVMAVDVNWTDFQKQNDIGYVYALCDPREPDHFKSVRYIGQTTKTPQQRLDAHLTEAQSTTNQHLHRNRWIRKLLQDGTRPVVVTLAALNLSDDLGPLLDEEKRQIAKYARLGAALTNADWNVTVYDHEPKTNKGIQPTKA